MVECPSRLVEAVGIGPMKHVEHVLLIMLNDTDT